MSPEPSNVNDTVPAGELLVDLSADKLLADRAYDSCSAGAGTATKDGSGYSLPKMQTSSAGV